MNPLELLFLAGPGGGLEWLFLALGIFGVAKLVRRSAYARRPVAHSRALPARRAPAGRPTGRPSRPSGQGPIDAQRLPASVRLKVGQIQRKAHALLAYANQFPVGSEELYVVRATLDDYIPSTLRAYLAMPPGSETVPVTADGKTAWQVLWDQLAVIERKIDEVSWSLHHRNAAQLEANGRFLEERFKGTPSELDRPG